MIQPLGAGWGATMAAFIRGVGLGDNILSFEPGVPIYVDDVYVGRPQGAIFDLLDLERVEVLRGPQGTLFGKNADRRHHTLDLEEAGWQRRRLAQRHGGNYNRLEARGLGQFLLGGRHGCLRAFPSPARRPTAGSTFSTMCACTVRILWALAVPAAAGHRLANRWPGHLGSRRDRLRADTLDENVQSGRAAFRFLINDQVIST